MIYNLLFYIIFIKYITSCINLCLCNFKHSYRRIYIFCKKLGIEVEANMEAVGRIREKLEGIRRDLRDFDLQKDSFPIKFDPLKDTIPADVDAQFDRAIAAAKANNEAELLEACHAIEAYFNFPKANEIVKHAEVPGGMYSNMVAQLKKLLKLKF